VLLAPLGALIGQLHFATKYPNDNFGRSRARTCSSVAPVLCALFGVGVAWMWRRRARWRWRVPALAAMGAIALVAAYSVHARFPPFGPDANTAAPFFDRARRGGWGPHPSPPNSRDDSARRSPATSTRADGEGR
jgi:hypothetical protein